MMLSWYGHLFRVAIPFLGKSVIGEFMAQSEVIQRLIGFFAVSLRELFWWQFSSSQWNDSP